MKSNEAEQVREKNVTENENRHRELVDTIKHTTWLRRRERECGKKNYLKK